MLWLLPGFCCYFGFVLWCFICFSGYVGFLGDGLSCQVWGLVSCVVLCLVLPVGLVVYPVFEVVWGVVWGWLGWLCWLRAWLCACLGFYVGLVWVSWFPLGLFFVLGLFVFVYLFGCFGWFGVDLGWLGVLFCLLWGLVGVWWVVGLVFGLGGGCQGCQGWGCWVGGLVGLMGFGGFGGFGGVDWFFGWVWCFLFWLNSVFFCVCLSWEVCGFLVGF